MKGTLVYVFGGNLGSKRRAQLETVEPSGTINLARLIGVCLTLTNWGGD